MGKYKDDVAQIRALVQPDQVHRDVYCDPELFELEMQRLWRHTWIYVGHDSQVPKPGDYYTADIAGQPVIMVRAADGEVHVLLNRCAHKGAKVVSAAAGNCRGQLRCPYHGWTYRTDGTLRTMPLKGGYNDTAFATSNAARGMTRLNSANYRGFVFTRLSAEGPSFEEYFGDSLSSIDNMADRSPAGKLEVTGGVLRYMHNCNWKMFVENLNDAMHPMVAHESSAGTARDLWKGQPADAPVPMVIEQFVPFVSNYDFFDRMGVQIYENGHSYTGVNFSIHSKYSSVPEYERSMEQAYGAERAHAILGEARHNTVYYPSLTIKGAIQTIRVVRPLAADKTLIESYTLRLVDAPDELLARSVMYTRLINAPTSAAIESARLRSVAVDLTDASATREVFFDLAKESPATTVIHCAGVTREKPLEEATLEDLDALAQLHLGAALSLVQANLPAMKAEHYGRIVLVSTRAVLGLAKRTVYSATKAGMISLARTWALELAPHGITANAVAPGPIAETEMFHEIIPRNSAKLDSVSKSIPVGRPGSPADVARAILFFASPDAAFITGQTLFVCGGTSVGSISF